jgi:hydrogenase maturation protease
VTPRVLVAGIGNIFLGDDGFGVEVANRLVARPEATPDTVRIEDFGIRGVHLAYELLEGYDALVLLDAVPMHEPPGTLAVIEVGTDLVPEPGDEPAAIMDAHSMSPATVLSLLAGLGGAGLGGKLERILVVGCEPATVEEGIGLSDPVAGAVEPAVALVEEVLGDLLTELHTQPNTQPNTGNNDPLERKASA